MITEHYKPLIKPEEIGDLARPCDVDREIAERAIEEATLLDIKPKLGDELFIRIVNDVEYSRLLEGGDYEDKNGGKHVFAGLKRALAYYAWGRLVKTGANHLTRFGYVNKNDDYSHAIEAKDRQTAYRDACAVADAYVQECFVYMANFPDIFPDYRGNGRLKSYRTRTKIIGN